MFHFLFSGKHVHFSGIFDKRLRPPPKIMLADSLICDNPGTSPLKILICCQKLWFQGFFGSPMRNVLRSLKLTVCILKIDGLTANWLGGICVRPGLEGFRRYFVFSKMVSKKGLSCQHLDTSSNFRGDITLKWRIVISLDTEQQI